MQKIQYLIIALLCMVAQGILAQTFGGGSGTEADPYIISTTEHFDQLSANVNSGNEYSGVYFRLDADLDYADKTLTPMGKGGVNTSQSTTGYYIFSGIFDGNGHTVKNVVINKPSGDNIGLFGIIAPYAVVKNLTLASSTIQGRNYIGGIVGQIFTNGYTPLTDRGCLGCAVADDVTVTGNENVGGIAGAHNSSGRIANCISFATVTGSKYVGSIVGHGSENDLSYNYYSGEGTRAGIGKASSDESYDVEGKTARATCRIAVTGLQVYPAANGKGGARYGNDVYCLEDEEVELQSGGIPFVISTPQDNGTLTPTSSLMFEGDGTADVPLLVNSIQQMNFIAAMTKGYTNYSGTHFRLEADLDYKPNNVQKDYYPIGNSTNSFNGVFDGNRHAIFNVNYQPATDKLENYIGLFGRLGGTVKNLIARGCRFYGINNVGTIAGYSTGTIDGCVVDVGTYFWEYAIVNGTRCVGGIVGMTYSSYFSSSYLVNCLANGVTVSATSDYGSIVGDYNGNVSNCYICDCSRAAIGWGSDAINYGGMAQEAYLIEGAEDVAIAKAGGTGVEYDGKIYAGDGQSVQLELSLKQDRQGFISNNYTASNGTLTKNTDFVYTLQMAAANTVVSATGTDYTLVLLDNDQAESYGNHSRIVDNLESGALDVKIRNRTLFKDGDWNTLCLPFDVSDGDADSEHPAASGGADGISFTGTPLEGADVRTLLPDDCAYSNGTLTLNFTAPLTAIEPGVPYIVRWTRPTDYEGNESTYDVSEPVFQNITLQDGYRGFNIFDGGILFFGMYVPYGIEGEDRHILYLGKGNKLYYPQTAMTINAFRAFFILREYVAGTPSLSRIELNFGGEEAGILSTTNSTNFTNSGAWYDLQGRKIADGQKPKAQGLYINNGRKIMVK